MALLERLQILIDADAAGALREFDKAGKAADKLDARLKGGSEKTAARLQSIGTKAVIGGAAVLGGLYKLAQASDDAEKQQLKLENSIKNSNKAFSNGGKGLTDLAQRLQQVTAADGDAIVGAQSLLVQFGLTEAQVKQLTPLVVDLSRKYGIGLDQAAKLAGKAVNGSAGALKKLGINVDEAALKADGFGTTVKALAGSVGGFARQEGATFSGQIAILKNNLGDLGESVGKGAAGVFANLAGDASKAVNALNNVNPAILETVGAVGASTALTGSLVGGFTFAAGKAIDFKKAIDAGDSSLVKVGEDGAKSLTKVGKAAAGIAIVGAVVGVIETVATISNSINQVDKLGQSAFDGFRGALKGTADDAASAFGKLAEVEDKTAQFSGIWEGFGAEVKLGNFKVDVEEAQRAFTKVLDTFGPEAAQKTIDGLRAQNNELDKNSDQYKTNARFIDENQKAVDKRREGLKIATIAERDQKKALQESIDKYDQQNATLEGIKKSLGEYEQRVRALNDAYDVAKTGASAFSDAIERSTGLDDIAAATVDLSDKLRTLNTDLGALPKNFNDAFDPTKISEKSGKAINALLAIGDAASKQFQTLIASGNESLVPGLAAQYRNTLTKALQAAGLPPDQIQKYLGLAGLTDAQIKVALKVTNVEEELQKAKQRLELFQTDLEKAPKSVRVAIDDALSKDDIPRVNRIIDQELINKKRTIKVGVEIDTSGYPTADATARRQGRIPDRTTRASNGNGNFGRGSNTTSTGNFGPTPNVSSSGNYGRAIGGPVDKNTPYKVNEVGPEMFVPSSDGFVMTSSDSKRLVAGVEAMLAGGGAGVKVDQINIASTDPHQTAREVVRGLRSATYLMGR